MLCPSACGSAPGRVCGLAPEVENPHAAYLTNQLRRRGVRHPARLAEALERAEQFVALEFWSSGGAPVDWSTRRAVLDRGVYRAIRELAPVGLALSSAELPAAPEPAEPSQRVLEGRALFDRIEALPVGKRLVVKLKLAGLFLPELPDRPPRWRDDEAVYLLKRHPEQTLESIHAALRDRISQGRTIYNGRVPAVVIAWLLGRRGGPAVDTAFKEIREALRRSGNRTPFLFSLAVPSRSVIPHGPVRHTSGTRNKIDTHHEAGPTRFEITESATSPSSRLPRSSRHHAKGTRSSSSGTILNIDLDNGSSPHGTVPARPGAECRSPAPGSGSGCLAATLS